MPCCFEPWDRTCPDCQTTFSSVQEWGVCPKCSLRFGVDRNGTILNRGNRPEDRSAAHPVRSAPRQLSKMAGVSPETIRRIEITFPPEEREEVVRMLTEECGNNLPFLEDLDEYELERFRFAALKMSGSTVDGLRAAIEVAQRDWRDLLMAAGFGQDIDIHRCWLPTGRVRTRFLRTRSGEK